MEGAGSPIIDKAMNQIHLKNFLEFNFRQGSVGFAPLEWATTYLKYYTSEPPLDALLIELPKRKLHRNDLYEICAGERDVLFGYVCVMAWGNQGKPGLRNPADAWESWQPISEVLFEIRRGLPRAEAYDYFTANSRSKFRGLGPAFFTKLITFFSMKRDAYIMDQWTARSVNLLTGSAIVQLTANKYVSPSNTGLNYEAFCASIEEITKICNSKNDSSLAQSAEEVEARLFSEGGKGSRAQPWRVYVRDHT